MGLLMDYFRLASTLCQIIPGELQHFETASQSCNKWAQKTILENFFPNSFENYFEISEIVFQISFGK
jgi:hypothetical protein